MINTKQYKHIENSWINNANFPKKRLKYLVEFVRGVEPGSKNYGIEGEGKRFIRVNDIGSGNKDNVFVLLETDATCNKEDILLCLDGSPGIVARDFEGIFSTGLRKIQLKDDSLNYNYLWYSLNCAFTQECIQFFSKGTTIMHASRATNYLIHIIPPKSKQALIAEFLDNKIGHINKIIENKKKQMKLVDEFKITIVKKTFEKGIGQEKIKKTNLFWLDTVPECWRLTKAKYVSSIFVPQRDKPKLNINSEGFPWVTMNEIGEKELVISKFYVTEIETRDNKSRTLKLNSVIASCVGNFGISSINTEEVIINQQLQAYVPKEINPFFLRYYIILSKSYYDFVATSTTIFYVNKRKFEELPIYLPKLDEQENIVTYLDLQINKCDKLSMQLRNEIQKLEEYKKILINDCVTGKMKVTA